MEKKKALKSLLKGKCSIEDINAFNDKVKELGLFLPDVFYVGRMDLPCSNRVFVVVSDYSTYIVTIDTLHTEVLFHNAYGEIPYSIKDVLRYNSTIYFKGKKGIQDIIELTWDKKIIIKWRQTNEKDINTNSKCLHSCKC